jgi:hypothetical protein
MRILLFLLFSTLAFPYLNAQASSPWELEMVAYMKGDQEMLVMGSKAIDAAKWNELSQPLFWREIMLLSPDSIIVNVASTRQIIAKLPAKRWNSLAPAAKSLYRDSVREANQLPETESIMVTTGKNHFYRFDLVMESLPMGVAAFEEYGVDPWYAQSILLIESPGQIKKSTAGAYGPFQLMPSVARAYGLTVNKSVDERKDFKKSAYAAASLIRRSCIPSARSIATAAGLTVDESAIWFRLLTMHVYHAGAGNVRAVVTQIGKVESGEELIRKMWVTKAGAFGNSSQNYSQLALAAHIQLADLIQETCTNVYECLRAYE